MVSFLLSLCNGSWFAVQKLYHGSMQFSELGSADMPIDVEIHEPYYLPRIDEDVEIRDNVAIINVPAPRFGKGDPAYILHDFKKVKEPSVVIILYTEYNSPGTLNIILSTASFIVYKFSGISF